MGILITGGAGFIGSHLAERLVNEDKEIFVLDSFDDFYDVSLKRDNVSGLMNKINFHLIEGDIRKSEDIEKLFKENNIEKIVHLAARAGVRPSIEKPHLYLDINIKGTLNLLEICRKYNIKNFIFGSSSSVYGLNKKIPFSETHKVASPISPYAASKASSELYCFTYSHLYGIPITCLRFFTVYGPRQRPEMAIHKFTRLIDQENEIEMYGDGTSSRDYTYISDIVDGIVSALEKKFNFEIFNLGNNKPIELKYLINLIEKNLEKKAKIKQLIMQAGDVSITYADISKAKHILDYNPKISIEEGIKKFVEWYKK